MTRIDRAHIASWLPLATAPSFAMMAALTAILGDGPAIMCGQQSSLLGGMVPMYLLMSAFHAAPWLKLIAASKAPRSASSAID